MTDQNYLKKNKFVAFLGVVSFLFAASGAVSFAQSIDVKKFKTESGICSQADIDKLSNSKGGFSYTIEPSDIRKEDGINPVKSGKLIPAMTGVTCHARGRNNSLTLISRSKDPAFCGWIPSSTLLKSKSNRSDGNLFLDSVSGVCDSIAPLTVAEYCSTMEKLDEQPEACDDEKVNTSEINAKFLVWNAALSKDQRKANALRVDKFRTSAAIEKWGSLDIYSVFRVYDIAQNEKGVFYLLGNGPQNMLGWVQKNSGTIWYTNLATFFSEKSNGEVYSDQPWLKDAIQIAERPENLSEMFAAKHDFSKYPVLFDRRVDEVNRSKEWEPYLEIGFIGRLCEKGLLCVDGGKASSEAASAISKADVMFVIDATNSMREYFGLVSKAIRKVVIDDKAGTPDYRFGLAMYGDFLRKDKQKLLDPIQFRTEIPLRPLRRGNEFDQLTNAKLYINDPSGGYPEAPYAALARRYRRHRGEVTSCDSSYTLLITVTEDARPQN